MAQIALLIVVLVATTNLRADVPTTLVVRGAAQLALAGQPNGTTYGSDSAPLNSPVLVNMPLVAGQGLQFRATGNVGSATPDGVSSNDYVGGSFGIGQIYAARGSLIGVFLADGVDSSNTPPNVDYTAGAREVEVLTPMLQQPFFIGGGKTLGGTARTIVVPTRATRLFLGVTGYSTSSFTGSFSASISVVAVPTTNGNPVKVYGIAQLALAGQPAGTTYSGDSAPLNAPVQMSVALVAGQGIHISATGTVGSATPDGTTSIDTTGGSFGIGRISAPRGALIGVFLRDSVDSNAQPPSVDYSGGARDLQQLSPLLQQPFFVGDGTTLGGASRVVVVPTGATRLFLGVMGYSTRSFPGLFVAAATAASVPGTPAGSITVPGVAQLALAGQPSGTTYGSDSAPLNSPVLVNQPLIVGQGLQIIASGNVGSATPDGTGYNTYVGGSFGIGRIYVAERSLIGVFLADAIDSGNRPPDVDYSAGAREVEVLTPMLQQPFFIGSGKTLGGVARTIVVPPRATRLYLGVTGYSTSSFTGSFAATVSAVTVPTTPGNPVRVYGIAQLALAGQPAGTTYYSDSAPLNSPVRMGVALVAGQGIHISATGTVGSATPDGTTPIDGTGGSFGIGQISAPRGALIGVFLRDSVDSRAAPPSVDYSGGARDLQQLRPMLQQPFFVGSGTTLGGAARVIIVPSGATRLFLGVSGYSTSSYSGSFVATATTASVPETPSGPVTIPGIAQLGLAGQPSGTTYGSDSAPLNSPVLVNMPLVVGQGLQITASGNVGSATPDGTSYNTAVGGSFGIGTIDAAQGSLIGVFLADAVESGNSPPRVDYTAGAREVEVLTPMLQQPFFIGSGTTLGGAARTIVVPARATRLFLGVTGYSTSSFTGSFTATISVVAAPTTSGNPVKVYGIAQLALAGQPAGTTYSGDSAPLNSPVQASVALIVGKGIHISATGAVGSATPDGTTSIDTIGDSLGIGRISAPRGALIGVFLRDSVDANARVPYVDYSGGGRDLPQLTPLLQQPFFVGTGMTLSGVPRTIVVPDGAKRLFLGVMGYSTKQFSGFFLATVEAGTPPTLSVDPGTLNISLQSGNISAPQNISLSASSPLDFTLVTSAHWLSATADHGTTPAVIGVSGSAVGLSAGQYNGTLTITAPGAANTPRIVQVTMVVTDRPGLALSTSSIAFNGAGSSTARADSTGPALPFAVASTTDSGGNWLSVAPLTGSTPTVLTITATPGALPPGEYSGTITVTAPSAANSPQTVRITLSVAPRSSVFANPQAVAVEVPAETTGIPAQVVQVSCTTENASFTVAPITDQWLGVMPTAGRLPQLFRISLNVDGLHPGTFSSKIVVHSAGNPDLEIPVKLVVQQLPPDAFDVQAPAMQFRVAPQSATPSQRIMSVLSRAGQELTFRVQTKNSSPWLTVSPQQATISPGQSAEFQVAVKPTALPAGILSTTDSVVVSGGGQPKEVLVTVSVSDDVLPQPQVSTRGITLFAVQGQNNLDSRSFLLYNAGSETLDWALTQDSVLLRVSQDFDTPLPAGAYHQLQVTTTENVAGLTASPNPPPNVVFRFAGLNDSMKVPVYVQVLDPRIYPLLPPRANAAGIIVGPPGLTEQTITLRNSTPRPASFIIRKPDWLSVTSPSQQIPALQSLDLTVKLLYEPTIDPYAPPPLITLEFPNYVGGKPFDLNIDVVYVAPPSGTRSSVTGKSVGSSTVACNPSRYAAVFTSPGNLFEVPAALPVDIVGRVVDDCGNAMASGAAIVTFSTGEPAVALTSWPDGTWRGTWQPLLPQNNLVTLRLVATATNSTPPARAVVTGRIVASGNAPVVLSNSVVNSASQQQGNDTIAPGEMISIYGQNLASQAQSTPNGIPAALLGGVQVLLGDSPVPLLYVGPTQINAVVPLSTPARRSLQLIVNRDGTSSVPVPVAVVPAQPGIFTVSQTGVGQGAIVNLLGTIADKQNPARRGDIVSIYSEGLGVVNPQADITVPAPSQEPFPRVVGPLAVVIGNCSAEVLFAGLAPGFHGLYQINVRVPENAPLGVDVPVQISVGNQPSNLVTMAVR